MSKIVLRWRKVGAGLKGGMLTLWKRNGCGGGAACSVIKVISDTNFRPTVSSISGNPPISICGVIVIHIDMRA